MVHTLASLAGAIDNASARDNPVVWSTFYDIRRYGGLQIFLRAVAYRSIAGAVERRGVDCGFSGPRRRTPGHAYLRNAFALAARADEPFGRTGSRPDTFACREKSRTRQSWTISTPSIPQARVAHAFASTEAGVAFDVTDGLAGFPASMIGESADVEMKVEDGSLRIRSCALRIAT